MLEKKAMGNKYNPINSFFETYDYGTWFEIEKSNEIKKNLLIYLTFHH